MSANSIVGAFLFSFGLFIICTYQLSLFTGKVGYLPETRAFKDLELTWIGNAVGIIASSGLLRIMIPELSQKAAQLMTEKLNHGALHISIAAVFCGFLIHIAVDNFKSSSNELSRVLGIILSVVIFILCGFEHSIADMSYAVLAISDWFELFISICFVILVSLGNALGAILANWIVVDNIRISKSE